MLVVVVYDIADDGRRARLATFLEGYGRRVQQSTFECFLSLAEMQDLYGAVRQRVNPNEDDVRFYWLSREAAGRTLAIGSAPPEPPPSTVIV